MYFADMKGDKKQVRGIEWIFNQIQMLSDWEKGLTQLDYPNNNTTFNQLTFLLVGYINQNDK